MNSPRIAPFLAALLLPATCAWSATKDEAADRLSTEAKYPAELHDCRAAIRYMRAHAAELKIDPERIGVMGEPAGGHLTGLLAMTTGKPEFEGDGPNREQSSSVKAAIVMAATQDLLAANKQKSSEGARRNRRHCFCAFQDAPQ